MVEGVDTRGGAGVLRNRYSGTNVTNNFIVRDCRFYAYTNAAISHNSTDMPNWKIERCRFIGANYTTTIGIALSGLTNESDITSCVFDHNKVGVKLTQGGNDTHITRCVFLSEDPDTNRIGVWLVPNPDQGTGLERMNSGQGFVISQTKFGSENSDTSDFACLIADESSGTYFGDTLPVMSVSSGWITGTTLDKVNYGAPGSPCRSLLYSSPHLEMATVRDVMTLANRPAYLVEWMAGALPTMETRVVIASARSWWPNDAQKATNVPQYCHIIDDNGQLSSIA